MTDLAAQLRALADQVADLEPARLVGELEALKFAVWTRSTTPPAPAPSRALAIEEVMARTGMSKGWLYREARAGRLPFARYIGRRLVFDQAGCTRWLARRTHR